MRTRLWRLVATSTALSIAVAACGSEESASFETIAAPDAETAGTLAAVCPDPVVIQTDWFPEAEYGATYGLIGDDYEVDVERRLVRGSLVSNDEDTGIDVEVRTGGPAIGSQPVATQLYVDDEITLGFANTDAAAVYAADAPILGVVAPLEKNPQIIMWDPETYPEVETIADLGELGVTVNIFSSGVFSGVLASLGILSGDQIDPSYDGSPSRFIAEDGAIAQQGFASAEPYYYEFVFEEWMKPVAFELIHDAGFRQYSQTISIRRDDLDALRPCLELLVPIYQQSAVDYVEDPAATNALIIDTVARFDDFWVYDEGVAEYSATTQKELGLVGNGPDETLGNFDLDRVQEVIDQMANAGMEIPEGLKAEDLVTNEFVDPSIGLP